MIPAATINRCGKPDCTGKVVEDKFKYHDHHLPDYFFGECEKCGTEYVRCGECQLLQMARLDSKGTGTEEDYRGVMSCQGCPKRWVLQYEKDKLVGIQKIEVDEESD